MKFLIGEISSYKAIVIANYVKKYYPNIFIHSYDFRDFTSIIRTKCSDKHHVLRNENIESYLKDISNIIERERIDFFLPVHSDYIGEILKNKELFGNSLSYLGSYEDYYKLHNKDSLQNIASKNRVEIPQKYQGYNQAQIPFICKPNIGSSAEGVVYIFSEKDRKRFSIRKFDYYIFQEYVEGVGCGYSVYAVNGEIKTGYGHIRLAEFPVTGGSSVYRASFYKKEMRNIAQKILEEIPWTGFAMFEFKLTPDGELVLIEVNPRIWGSINQGLQNGINYFEPMLHKSEMFDNKQKKNIKTYLSPQIYLSIMHYILKGNLRPFLRFIKNIKYNKADISFVNDPRGWMSVILRKIL